MLWHKLSTNKLTWGWLSKHVKIKTVHVFFFLFFFFFTFLFYVAGFWWSLIFSQICDRWIQCVHIRLWPDWIRKNLHHGGKLHCSFIDFFQFYACSDINCTNGLMVHISNDWMPCRTYSETKLNNMGGIGRNCRRK